MNRSRRKATFVDRDRERREWAGKRAFPSDTYRRSLRPIEASKAAVCYVRNTSIVLKNSEIEPLRKSSFRARRVVSANSLHGRACRTGARGKPGRSAEPPRNFPSSSASGRLNCDRCGNSSFSTQSVDSRRWIAWTSRACRIELTRSKLLSGTVSPGALAPSSLRRLCPRFRPSRNQRCPPDLLN